MILRLACDQRLKWFSSAVTKIGSRLNRAAAIGLALFVGLTADATPTARQSSTVVSQAEAQVGNSFSVVAQID